MEAVEFDFVVKDSLKAIELYERIFPVERVEVTDFKMGSNEAVFNIFGTRFHMLDENPEFQLFAPKEGSTQSSWFNVTVKDINKTHHKAIKQGCTEIQAVTKLEDFGVSNAIFLDPFGYVWMLHERHEEVGFEKRMEILREDFE